MRLDRCAVAAVFILDWPPKTHAFLPATRQQPTIATSRSSSCCTSSSSPYTLRFAAEWTSDFDDFVDEDEETALDFAQIFQNRPPDYTAIQTRQFSLGQDLILVDYVGNMGFDEGM